MLLSQGWSYTEKYIYDSGDIERNYYSELTE